MATGLEISLRFISNAKALAAALISKGYYVISGGTDNHLMLVDLRNKNITGKELETALDKSGITVNKNAVPFDDKPPLITSGVRIGTAAVTTRGMKESEMQKIADFIDTVAMNIGNDSIHAKIRADVKDLTNGFPLYADDVRS